MLIVHEACKTGGFGGEVAASAGRVAAFDHLDAPIRLAGRAGHSVPYNRDLERRMVPRWKTSSTQRAPGQEAR